MPKADRDAYDLEATPERRYLLTLACQGRLEVRQANQVILKGEATATAACVLDEKHQKAYLELAREGLLIGSILTGKGHRAATDWKVIT